eukprot:354935-Chlamydomonas_euryale.AAC.8
MPQALEETFDSDPLFGKTSKLFDEAGAAGLLLLHAGVYARCEVLFDAGDVPSAGFPLPGDEPPIDTQPDINIDLSAAPGLLAALRAGCAPGALITPSVEALHAQLGGCGACECPSVDAIMVDALALLGSDGGGWEPRADTGAADMWGSAGGSPLGAAGMPAAGPSGGGAAAADAGAYVVDEDGFAAIGLEDALAHEYDDDYADGGDGYAGGFGDDSGFVALLLLTGRKPISGQRIASPAMQGVCRADVLAEQPATVADGPGNSCGHRPWQRLGWCKLLEVFGAQQAGINC